MQLSYLYSFSQAIQMVNRRLDNITVAGHEIHFNGRYIFSKNNDREQELCC